MEVILQTPSASKQTFIMVISGIPPTHPLHLIMDVDTWIMTLLYTFCNNLHWNKLYFKRKFTKRKTKENEQCSFAFNLSFTTTFCCRRSLWDGGTHLLSHINNAQFSLLLRHCTPVHPRIERLQTHFGLRLFVCYWQEKNKLRHGWKSIDSLVVWLILSRG